MCLHVHADPVSIIVNLYDWNFLGIDERSVVLSHVVNLKMSVQFSCNTP